jgi:hypothetical protein
MLRDHRQVDPTFASGEVRINLLNRTLNRLTITPRLTQGGRSANGTSAQGQQEIVLGLPWAS